MPFNITQQMRVTNATLADPECACVSYNDLGNTLDTVPRKHGYLTTTRCLRQSPCCTEKKPRRHPFIYSETAGFCAAIRIARLPSVTRPVIMYNSVTSC